MRRLFTRASVPVLALAFVAAPAAAQVSVGADAAVYSAYVWRGLSLTNRPVAQPDLWLAFPLGGSGSITVGGWGSIDLGKYDDANDHISEGGGIAGPDLTEFDWWAEYATSLGSASLSLGVTGYIYPNDKNAITNTCCQLNSANNTIEVYAQLGLSNAFNPSLSAYYDVDKIKGLYLEGSISHDLAISPSFTLTLGALAAFNAGMGCEADTGGNCTVQSNFFDSGFTHADFSVATSFSAGSLSFTPAFHFQVSSDEFTKFNSPTKVDESSKIWFGVAVAWASGGGDEEATE